MLAEQLAPQLPSLVHPGDDTTPPFPLALSVFHTATLPEGLAQEQAEDMGLPTPNLALHFTEAFLHLIDQLGHAIIPKSELADLRAAATAREHKRHERKEFLTTCGHPVFRAMIQDFDTDHPRIPCDVITAIGRLSPDCATGHRA